MFLTRRLLPCLFSASLALLGAANCKSRDYSTSVKSEASQNTLPLKHENADFSTFRGVPNEAKESLDALYASIVEADKRNDQARDKRKWDKRSGLEVVDKMLEWDTQLGVVKGFPLNPKYKNYYFQWLDESLGSQGEFVFDEAEYNRWLTLFLTKSSTFKAIVDGDELKNENEAPEKKTTPKEYLALQGGMRSPLIKEWIYVISSGIDGGSVGAQNRHRIKIAPLIYFKTKGLGTPFGLPIELENFIKSSTSGKVKAGLLNGHTPLPPHPMLASSTFARGTDAYESDVKGRSVSVLAAGSIEFDDVGRILLITNSSGHFLPDYTILKRYDETVFALHGVAYKSSGGTKLKVFERETTGALAKGASPIKRLYCGYSQLHRQFILGLGNGGVHPNAEQVSRDAFNNLANANLVCTQ